MSGNFLSTTDWSPDEVASFLEFSLRVKSGRVAADLRGKVMGMLFFNSSLRTRMSFEAAILGLGGHAINLSVGHGVWDLETEDGVVMDGEKAEHVREAAPVISRYADVLGVRCFAEGADWQRDRQDPVIAAFARFSTVPVINMESGVWHPCQALADALTWDELGIKRGDKVVLTWAWHPKALPMAVPNSVAAIAAQRGLNLTVMRPEGFELDREIMDRCRRIAAETGGSIEESADPLAIRGAKVVYAKSWGSIAAYGRPQEEKAIRDEYRNWQVTEDWMSRTDGAKFMHCLPVRRNVVVADEVLDSRQSIVVAQAENRLHAQKALLMKMLLGK